MAFPVVQDSDTQSGTRNSNSTSWTLTYPTNVVNGDLLLLFIGRDGSSGSPTLPAGWNVYIDSASGTACRLVAAYKRADGTETGNFTYNPGASEQGAWRCIRVTGVHGSSDPAVGTAATGTSVNPNPPNNDPAGWGTEDTLWIACYGQDDGRRSQTAIPTNYSNGFYDASGGSGGAALGTARRTNAVSAENPGTFTISNSQAWVAQTVAIRPATVVVATGGVALPALDATGAGTVATGPIHGSGNAVLPNLEASGFAGNSRKFSENFEYPIGYDNSGWTETGSIFENFLSKNVPGGRPPGWNAECLRNIYQPSEAISPTFTTLSKAYLSYDIVLGSETLADGDIRPLLSFGTSTFNVFNTHLRQTAGDLRFRFEVETSASTYTTHDWATNLALDTRYIVEFYWDINADDYEIWVNGVSAFSGSTTATRQPNRIVVGGTTGSGGGYTAYIDRIEVDSQGRVPIILNELPILAVAGTGKVAIEGTGNAVLGSVDTFTPLTADSTAWTADSTIITADRDKYPASDAMGEVLVEGTSIPTLPALFADGQAVVAVKGSGTPTLPALDAAGEGTAVGVITGSGAVALPALDADGVADNPVQATGGATLPALDADGVADNPVQASGSALLPGLEVAAAGAAPIDATGAVLLPALQVDALGTSEQETQGTGTVVLAALVASGAAETPALGAGDAELGALEASGQAVLPINGTGSADLPELTASGQGVLPIGAAGDADLPALQASGAGTSQQQAQGTGAVVLGELQAAGQSAVGVAGVGGAGLPAVSASAQGELPLDGSGAAAIPALQASGAGAVSIAGQGAAPLPALDASGSSSAGVVGAGGVALPAVLVTAQGDVGIEGTGSAVLPSLEASGTGAIGEVTAGSGAVNLGALQAGGSAKVVIGGSATIALPVLDVAADGSVSVAGTGAAELGALFVQAAGVVQIRGDGLAVLPVLQTSGTTAPGRPDDLLGRFDVFTTYGRRGVTVTAGVLDAEA
jgi:hypothetical protein